MRDRSYTLFRDPTPNQAVYIADYNQKHRAWWMQGLRSAPDGRVYNRELAPEVSHNGECIEASDREKLMESVTPATLKTIERFLSTGHSGLVPTYTQVERGRLVKEYGLVKHERIWQNDKNDPNALQKIYDKIVAKFPQAEKYGSFKALQYAAQYGDAPCKVYKESNETDRTE